MALDALDVITPFVLATGEVRAHASTGNSGSLDVSL
jgi:hypothetical protein